MMNDAKVQAMFSGLSDSAIAAVWEWVESTPPDVMFEQVSEERKKRKVARARRRPGVQKYFVHIEEMAETIEVYARSPQAAYDIAEREARAMFSPAPDFETLTIGVMSEEEMANRGYDSLPGAAADARTSVSNSRGRRAVHSS